MTSRPRSQLARHSACARTSTHVHVRVTRTSSPDSRDRDHLLPPSRCDTAGLARRACSGEAGLLRGGELGRSRRASCGCSSRTSRVQRQVWWISLSPHNPAQVRCCAVQLQHTTVVGLAAWRGTSFMAVDFSSPRDDATFHHMALFFYLFRVPVTFIISIVDIRVRTVWKPDGGARRPPQGHAIAARPCSFASGSYSDRARWNALELVLKGASHGAGVPGLLGALEVLKCIGWRVPAPVLFSIANLLHVACFLFSVFV